MRSALLFAAVFGYAIIGQALEYRWLEHYDDGWGYSYDERQQDWVIEQRKRLQAYHSQIRQDEIEAAFEELFVEEKNLQEQTLPDGRKIRLVLGSNAHSISVYVDDQQLFNSETHYDEHPVYNDFVYNTPVSISLSPNNRYLVVTLNSKGSTITGNLLVYKLDKTVSVLAGIENIMTWINGHYWVGPDTLRVMSAKFKGYNETLDYDFLSGDIQYTGDDEERDWEFIDQGRFAYEVETTYTDDGDVSEEYIVFREYGSRRTVKAPLRDDLYPYFKARTSKHFVFADNYRNPHKLILVPYRQSPVLEVGEPKILETIKSGAIQNIITSDEYLLVEYLAGPFRNYRLINGRGEVIAFFNSPRAGSIKSFKHIHGERFEFVFSSPVVPKHSVEHDFSSMPWQPAKIDQELLMDKKGKRYNYQFLFATSADGTRVPVQTFRRADLEPNPATPLYMPAYGGHGMVAYFVPRYRLGTHLFLAAGGIYATPAVRGGGEYGNSWYEQVFGTKVRYEDTASVLRELHRLGFGSPHTTAFEGWSNGGLLAGVMLTQYPELFKLVIPGNGLHDMVRKEVLEDDGRTAWRNEFGGHGSKEEVEFLKSYSPFIFAQEKKSYPSVYVMVGKHDQRVNPSHSFKLVAALQDSQQGNNPIIMHRFDSSGHWPTSAGWEGRRGLEGEIAKWKVIFHELGMRVTRTEEQLQSKK